LPQRHKNTKKEEVAVNLPAGRQTEKKTSYNFTAKESADLRKIVPRPFKKHEKYLINKQ
jgi:hypothetical protein